MNTVCQPELEKHGSGLTAFIALAAGMAIANNYALQPALPDVARTLHIPLASTGWIAGCLQIGYMLGIVLLVPLGDRLSASRLVVWQFGLLAVALFWAAVSPTFLSLLLACVWVGAMATNAVHLQTIAFRIAEPQQRGRMVGTVAAGISAGILLSRFVGGSLAQASSWRMMLTGFGLCALIFTALSLRLLPDQRERSSQGYAALLTSLPTLLRKHALLREGALVGACWFFVFSMLWVTLMLQVSTAPLHLNTTQAGLLGFAGGAGLLATRPAGRLADRFGARPLILSGLFLVMAGVAMLGLWPQSLPLTIAGIVLFDVGCFAAQVANQTRLMAIDAEARSRIYSVYMFIYYAAGAAGSIMGPLVLSRWGWTGVTVLCLVLTMGGAAWTVRMHRHSELLQKQG
ncbi:Major facilitator superfamily MFS_1 [Thiomonas sp. X19]|uniref:MFS transporter n=1 Tax=Thiomonas sp. X19 TaxID=1050370 RepID=UPI000B6FAAAD|nr:MFS transporter [Thiomonas sp. X19]SCC93156.1 Major facilitator superfamily MFS_1 [Thiomonas sp. X19]